MKVAIAQLNPTVGNIDGNLNKAFEVIKHSKGKSDIVVFSELYICGYPPKDLLVKPWFIKKCENGINKIIAFSKNNNIPGIIIGAPVKSKNIYGKGLYNSALLIEKGKIIFQYNKVLLPNYDVFDEERYFDEGKVIEVIKYKGENLGLTICEDVWNNSNVSTGKKNYKQDPLNILSAKGATTIINISASPYSINKETMRRKTINDFILKYNFNFIYVNQVGGNDELIFDGLSRVINLKKNMISIFPSFSEKIEIVDLKDNKIIKYKSIDKITSIYKALIMGVRDYFIKCGFKKAVIGLSGGIDSAVTCVIAKEALGAENIFGISMPSIYSSVGSIKDSEKLAENLNIKFDIIPINNIFQEYLRSLKPNFKDLPENTAEENIQARIRGNILMAISNKFGYIVLSTGNKSELAVGYCTLYGDMSGGLSVISDIPKTLVYEIAKYINNKNLIIPNGIIPNGIIPNEIIIKPPSAELKPNQFDQDTLPPYEILDKILYYYIEENCSVDEITNLGYDKEIVKWVVKKVIHNEYKRYQAAPGLKITEKAFGFGRRIPIAAKYN